MRVIEEKHEKYVPKNHLYVYRCHNCGSIIELEDKDIKMDLRYGDIHEWFVCPVCGHHRVVFGRLFHRKEFWKFKQKIKKLFK